MGNPSRNQWSGRPVRRLPMNPNHTVMVEGLRLPRLVVDQMMARACSPWGRVIDWCDALRDHNPKLWPIKHNPESEPIEKAAGR